MLRGAVRSGAVLAWTLSMMSAGPVPPDSVVVGVPGHVIMRTHARGTTGPADLDNAILPDVVGVSLRTLHDRIEDLEARLDGGGPPDPDDPLRASSDPASARPASARAASARPAGSEVWYEQDFSI